MRISTSQLHRAAVSAMLDQQAEISRTQEQLATGRRILRPSDDPAGSARILGLQEAQSTTEQYQENAQMARSRLGLEEASLVSVGNILQRVRELAIQGNNDTLSSEDRDSIAQEVRRQLDGLLALANTRDANNEYIFAGYQGFTQPFSATAAGGFNYAGDDGQRFLQVGPSRQMAIGDSGTEVFRAIKNGNGTFTTNSNPANNGSGVIDPGTVDGSFVADTYTIAFTQALPTDPITYSVTGVTSGVVIAAGTPYSDGADISFNGVRLRISGTPADGDSFTVSPSVNQDLFTTVQNLAQTLENGAGDAASRAQFRNAMNRFLADVDQGMENILAVRSRVGARLNALDEQQNLNEDFLLQIQSTISQIRDLDYAEAASRMNLQLIGLEAAQQTFVRVQGLSLFNYLRF